MIGLRPIGQCILFALVPLAMPVQAEEEPIRARPDSVYLRELANSAFHVGEELTFLVKFGPLKAGRAVMRIPEIALVRGRPCYRIISEIRSNRFVSTFFKVDDYVESLMDTAGLFPWYFKKHIREGKFAADREVIFDHRIGLVYEDGDTVAVPPFTQDVLSIFYFIRTQKLIVGKTLLVENYADKKHYPLKVRILKKERIKVPAGTFECFVIEPGFRGSGLFKQKGKLWLWLSTDRNHVPVRIKSQISVGSIVMELQKAAGVVTDRS